MPYVPVNFVLQKELQQGTLLEMPYPKGSSQGSFFGAFNHTISITGRFFRAPGDFIIIPEKEKIVLKWTNIRVVPAGEIVNMQLEELGMNYYFDERTGTTLKNTVIAPLFLVSFQAPAAADEKFFLDPTLIKSSGSLPIKNRFPDVTRSVTIHSTMDNSNRVFRIEGEDPYFRTMIEEIKGPVGGVVETNKAFAKISRIIVSGECQGEVHIGSGRKLGFPVFLPGPAFVVKVIFDGKEVTGGTLVAGEFTEPTATSSDRRGFYIPPESVALDGVSTLMMLVSLPNPGNIGSPDFGGTQ